MEQTQRGPVELSDDHLRMPPLIHSPFESENVDELSHLAMPYRDSTTFASVAVTQPDTPLI